jgi:hypothetical protein
VSKDFISVREIAAKAGDKNRSQILKAIKKRGLTLVMKYLPEGRGQAVSCLSADDAERFLDSYLVVKRERHAKDTPKKEDTKAKQTSPALRVVLIFTERQELFYGFTANNLDDRAMLLTRARLAIQYRDTLGVLGLVAVGPNPACRISKPVPKLYVRGVEWAAEVESQEAQAAWELGPWRSDD